jgi:pyruvate kinase
MRTIARARDIGSGPASAGDGAPTRAKPHAKPEVALTKILATLGPATDTEEVLSKLVDAGARLFRLNFSHGNFEDHKRRLELVRRVSYRKNLPLTVVGDLPGPKLRVGKVPDPGIELVSGQEVIIRADVEASIPGDRPILKSDYAPIAAEVHAGHRVLINDGAVRMLVVESDGTQLVCRVTTGGLVTTRKGLNLPDSELSVPAVTERDLDAVKWAVENGVDYLALSFVRKADEVRTLRAAIEKIGIGPAHDPEAHEPSIPIIAKIETPQAVKNISDIIAVADGLMVARGDLGVELEMAAVPMIQKRLVRAAHEYGKPCIVATQMLESMIDHANPTRAEVSDVANAILDGADCVMLSGETAVGKYPVLAVEMMHRVALVTEAELRASPQEPSPPAALRGARHIIPALAHGAWHMARDIGAKAMVIWSQSGGGARYLSRHSFHIPIVAFSSDERAVRRMNLLYAVFPVLWMDVPDHRTEFARSADKLLLDEGWVERNDPVVLIAGKPMDKPGSANTVAIRYAGALIADDGAPGTAP